MRRHGEVKDGKDETKGAKEDSAWARIYTL